MKKTIPLFLLLVFCLPVFSQNILRLEPQNWWVGMKYNTLTLLVYGQNCSQLTPSFDYKGVQLLKTETVENPNYLFVTLVISPQAEAGVVKLNFKKGKKTLFVKDFPLLPREENSANREGFSSKDNILLIVPDRFANGNPTNDNTNNTKEKLNRNNIGGRHGGDIEGIIQHLDYIKSLGYTQIWNTPLIENDMPAYSYHGYAATDFYKIDPRFGTNQDFKRLVSEAKKREIGLIWDVVLNHCGSEYYLYKDPASKDWFNPSNHFTNHLKATLLDPHTAKIDQIAYNDGWFSGTMPDFNQKNPFVASFLTQNTIWWIEFAGLSGFRVDTFSYSDKNFLKNWTKTIVEEYPNFNIVGEEWTSEPELVAYWQKGKQNKDGYECYLPSVMDFALVENLSKSLNLETTWASSWKQTYESLAKDFYFPDTDNLLIFADNHDMDRFFTQVNGNFEHWKLGIALFATMRGIPQFQYGTELLFTNEQRGNHGQIRSDFYGGFKDDAKDAKTGKGLTEQEKEAQNYFSNLLNWRKNKSVVHSGKLKHFGIQLDDVYVYFRYNEKEKIMVALNKNKEKVTLDLNRYQEIIGNQFEAFEVITKKNIKVDKTLEIPAKTAFILEIK